MTDDFPLTWHKSSYSNGSGGNCIEVADSAEGRLVRDSKDRGRQALAFSPGSWAGFVTAVREGTLP